MLSLPVVLRRNGRVSLIGMDLDKFLAEAIRLMAEDVRAFRKGLAITSARAAKRARVSLARYMALERGKVPRSPHNSSELLMVAQRLGMESIRATYADEIGQFMNIDLSNKGLITVSIDALESDFPGLKDQGHFVAASHVMSFVERIGRSSIIDSKKQIDKQIAELWIAAAFTLGLSADSAYYVRPVREDPPDVEVLVVDAANSDVSVIRVEVTRCTRYSEDVFEVIRKKLLKRYHEGTAIVVLIEESTSISTGELYDFIRDNNLQNQRVYIVGGGMSPRTIKFIPCYEVPEPGADEMAIMDADLHLNHASKGYLGYEGVVYRPPWNSSIRYPFPIFVKKITLTR